MQSLTSGFESGITGDIRKIYGKVVFRILDVNASEDVTLTASSVETVSDINFINDGTDEPLVNYATFEDNSWLLDGSKALMPDSSYTNMGWWSSALSHLTLKTFTPNLTITATGSENHSTIGFTIIFDEANNECAEDFDIVYKNSVGATIQTVAITGNSVVRFISDVSVADWRSVEVVIKKWSVGGRRARVQEVRFGIIEVYEGSRLRGFEVTQEIDLLSSKIIPNEFKFTIDNQAQEFDMNNPTGKFVFLQKQQEVEPYIGVPNGSFIEYASMGIFYLDTWETDRSSLEANFEGFDSTFLLGQNKYRKGVFGVTNLKTLIESVLIDGGIKASKFNVDSALSLISVSSPLPIDNYKDVLKHALIVGRATLLLDAKGVMQIKQMGLTHTGETLSLDYMGVYPKFDLDKVIYAIDTEVTTWNQEASASEVFKGTLNVNGTQDVWVEYQCSIGHSLTLSSGTLNSVNYYSYACKLNITHTGDTEVVIDGYKVEKSNYFVSTLTGEESGETVTVKSDLIENSILASQVGDWAKEFYIDRKLVENEFRGNPKFEVGDLVVNETEFGDVTDARIYKQNYIFNGGLRATVFTKGGAG